MTPAVVVAAVVAVTSAVVVLAAVVVTTIVVITIVVTTIAVIAVLMAAVVIAGVLVAAMVVVASVTAGAAIVVAIVVVALVVAVAAGALRHRRADGSVALWTGSSGSVIVIAGGSLAGGWSLRLATGVIVAVPIVAVAVLVAYIAVGGLSGVIVVPTVAIAVLVAFIAVGGLSSIIIARFDGGLIFGIRLLCVSRPVPVVALFMSLFLDAVIVAVRGRIGGLR